MSKCFHLSCSCLFSLERKISSHEEGWKTYCPMITLPLITLNTFLKLLKDRNGFSAISVYHVPRKSMKRVSKQHMFSKSNLHLKMRQSWWRPSRPSWLSGRWHSGITWAAEEYRGSRAALCLVNVPSFCLNPASLTYTTNLTKSFFRLCNAKFSTELWYGALF